MFWNRSEHSKDEDLSAYIDGEVSAAVAAHIEACERCRQQVAELSQAKALLASLPRETPRRSFTVSEQTRPVPARRSPLVFAPAMALSALVLLIAVDLSNTGSMSNDSSTAGDTALTAEKASEGAATAPQADRASPAGTPVEGFSGSPPAITSNAEDASRNSGGAQQPTSPQPGADSDQQPGVAVDDDGSGGISTLRALEIAAALLLAASVLGVYVWPRLKKGN